MSDLKLESFLGISFYTLGEEVKKTLEQKPGCIFDEENSDQDALFFNGLKFAGRETFFLVVSLFENKFCKASVFIKPKLDAHAHKGLRVYRIMATLTD